MVMGSSSKDAVIPLLAEYYQRIAAIETDVGLWVSGSDYRPRIDRFQDAVRAYTKGESPHLINGRLSIEQLAWDIDMLRRIQAKPLIAMPGSHRQSPSTDLMVKNPNAVNDPGNLRMQAKQFRIELSDLYKNYAVMFTALLAETADMNFASRMEDKDLQVEALAELRATLTTKNVNLQQSAAAQIYDPDIREQINALLPKGTLDHAKANASINGAMNYIDQQQQQMNKAHIGWLSGQNQMYQQGKEVVQKLMNHGMNLAGKFLQEAMQRGGTGQGRGY